MTGFKGYLNRQETTAILRWAHAELEVIGVLLKQGWPGDMTRSERLRGMPETLAASLSFYEGLILKLEGHKDGTRKTD